MIDVDLKQYYNKKVSIICSNGQTFSGTVDDFFFAEDNESGNESIILKTGSDDFYEFTEEDIERIQIL